MATTITVTCGNCGRAFEARDKKRGQARYFCSRACFLASRRTGLERPCEVCGAPTYRKISHAKEHVFCSVACARVLGGALTSAKAPRGAARKNWKGGVIYRGGYRFVLHPDHPNANAHGYIAEHRLVMSEKLGRPLKRTELVHHVDQDKLNNDPGNLVIVRRQAHSRAHRLQKVLGTTGWSKYTDGCVECGTTEREHVGKGLCSRCYSRAKSREYAAMRPRKPHVIVNTQNMARGERCPQAKLTEDRVRSLRAAYAAGGVRMIDLAERYGISLAQVHNVLKGKAWQHVI